jgi:hypothetical protein
MNTAGKLVYVNILQGDVIPDFGAIEYLLKSVKIFSFWVDLIKNCVLKHQNRHRIKTLDNNGWCPISAQWDTFIKKTKNIKKAWNVAPNYVLKLNFGQNLSLLENAQWDTLTALVKAICAFASDMLPPRPPNSLGAMTVRRLKKRNGLSSIK